MEEVARDYAMMAAVIVTVVALVYLMQSVVMSWRSRDD